MANNDTVTRYSCLLFLTLQNTALVLTLRYSRTLPGPRYLTSTAVLLSEVLKCIFSLGAYGLLGMRSRRNIHRSEKVPEGDPRSIKDIEDDNHSTKTFPPLIPTSRKDLAMFMPVLVPACLYTLQNNLQFIAISNLDVVTFQVAYQGKILTTAVCAVAFLGKRLSRNQVLSVCLLTVGVALASVPSDVAPGSRPHGTFVQSHTRGMLAVGGSCVLSGFAGIYTEIIMKTAQHRRDIDELTPAMRFWYRNFQLASACIMFALPGTFIVDHQTILESGFLYGYNRVVWFTIVQYVLGGFAIASVITFADNILKGFATSISVILSTLASSFIWNTTISKLSFAGMFAVIMASQMYGYAEYSIKKRAERLKTREVPYYDEKTQPAV